MATVTGSEAPEALDKGLKAGALGFVSSVVIGEGENPITGAVLGSVVLKLVQRCKRPLLVAPTT